MGNNSPLILQIAKAKGYCCVKAMIVENPGRVKEVAIKLGVCRRTVQKYRRLVRTGECKCLNVPGCHRI